MSKVRVTWIDSVTAGVTSYKVFRDDVLLNSVAPGVQYHEDDTADPDTNYKYEVQSVTADSESVQEVDGVNTDNITTQAAPIVVTNYVFDGGALSYMKDKAVTANMLDGIINQSWFIRAKRTVNAQQHGLIGCENNTTAIKLEVDASDDKMDGSLKDNGETLFTNAASSLDLGWHNYVITYDGTTILCFEDSVQIRSNASAGFIGRTAGRVLAIGAAVIGGASPGWLIGEVSDFHLYNTNISQAEIDALETDVANVAVGLVANFAGQKTNNGALAGDWTSEVGGFVLENKGTVTYN